MIQKIQSDHVFIAMYKWLLPGKTNKYPVWLQSLQIIYRL